MKLSLSVVIKLNVLIQVSLGPLKDKFMHAAGAFGTGVPRP